MQIRDRFRLTKQALESLAAAGMTGMNVTVLVDRSNDQTRGFVFDWCWDHGAHYVRNEEPLGTGQLRNMVIEESRRFWGQGDYVAPHDNDTYFNTGWLDRLVACYECTEEFGFRIMGAYGHPYHHPLGSCIAHTPYGDRAVREVQALATQSMFMRWSTWDQYGPFCDTPIDKTCQSEDVDFTNRLRKDGYKLGVVYPHLIHATALKNTFGEPGPGWELVKADCPPGIICE
jgi:GT2 family glycosyltransferase